MICFGYADLLSGYLLSIRFEPFVGWCNATIRAMRWAIRDAVSQHNRLRALQKKQWLLGLKWQKGLNKRIHPVNAPELVRDLNLCER